MAEPMTETVDLLVVGAGAAVLIAAVTARKDVLKLLVVEKADKFGVTNAFSGGVRWIPGNRHSP